MVLSDDDGGNLARRHGDLDRHRAFLAVHGGLVFAVRKGLAHIKQALRAVRVLGEHVLGDDLNRGLEGVAGRRFGRHRRARSQTAEDDRAHHARAAGDEASPDAADALAGRVQTRNDRAVHIQHLTVGVGAHAAQRHHDKRLERDGVVMLALDLVDRGAVGGIVLDRVLGVLAAELVGLAGFDVLVVALHGRLEVRRRDAQLFGQHGEGIRRDHGAVIRLARRVIEIPEYGSVERLGILDDFVGEDVVLNCVGLLFQRGLARHDVRVVLVGEAEALLIDGDAARLPHVGGGDHAHARRGLVTHRESRNVAHGRRVDVRADLLHHVDAVAVRRGGAADQIVRAVLGERGHHLRVAGIAAGRHDDGLLRLVADGLAVFIGRQNGQHLTKLVGDELVGRRVEVDGHALVGVRRQHGIHDLVRGGLVAGRVVGAGLVGARHGIELMLRGEHGMLARGLHGREVVFGQAVVPQPLDRVHVLVNERANHRFVAQMRAVIQNILNKALLGVLDAVDLLNHRLRAGHGAGGEVQRTARLAGLFQNDDALSAVVHGLDGRGQTAAARADDDDIGVLDVVLRRRGNRQRSQQHGQHNRQKFLHVGCLLHCI